MLTPHTDLAALVSGVHELFRVLVTEGAALGWVTPPDIAEVADLIEALTTDVRTGDAAAALARDAEGALIGFGYWRRYHRPTHRPHADLERLGVRADRRRRGTAIAILDALVAGAIDHRVEQLTLDSRGDSEAAHQLWRSRGFVEYGRLVDFVAVGDNRYDKTFWVLDLREDRPT